MEVNTLLLKIIYMFMALVIIPLLPTPPQQNGISERRHRHLIEIGFTLLTDAQMPLSYWPYAFQAATYLINRMSTSTLNNKTPFELLFHQNPNYMKLK